MTSLSGISFVGLESQIESPELRDRIRDLVLEQLASDESSGQLSHQDKVEILGKLPRLDERQVIALGHDDSVCPVCFVPLLALLAEEEQAIAMDSPAHPIEELGVTKLSENWQCGHLFCRRDITRWINEGHNSCPTCRRRLTERDQATTEQQPPMGNNQGQGPRDAYDPEELSRILEHIQTSSEIGVFNGDFLSEPHSGFRRATPDDNGRSEYVGMYS